MSQLQVNESKLGYNRTGIGASPLASAEMLTPVDHVDPQPAPGDGERALASVRQVYATSVEPVGTVPLPSSLKGLVKTTVDLYKGQKPSVFLDKLGERLAFERTGVRIYEALIDKLDALGSWVGGPTREELLAIQKDELGHFELLRQIVESLGADPTAVTPAADLSGTEALGIVQVLADPRTTLPQALHAILTIELVDNDGWEMLIRLAKSLDNAELAQRMEAALRDEERHLTQVRSWVIQEVQLAAKRELQNIATA